MSTDSRDKKTQLKWKNSITNFTMYEPGKPIAEVEREFGLRDVIKLASNENPLGPSPKALKAIQQQCGDINLYPESSCYYLVEKLSQKLQVPANMLICGGGSVEVIKWLYEGLLEPGDEIITADVSFHLYVSLTHLYNATAVSIPLDNTLNYDLDKIASAVTKKTKVIGIVSPNNPTGVLVEYPKLVQFLPKIPKDILVVLDLAYIEYVPQNYGERGMELLRQHENVIILRTFSKAYGLAGARVGYGIAHPDIVQVLNRIKSPFSVNSLAQIAAIAALDDEEHVKASVELNEKCKGYLYTALDSMKIKYYPTFANFILIDTGKKSEAVFQALLKLGVIVRPMKHPRINTCIRVTIGTMEQNRTFIDKLKQVLPKI